MIINLNHTPQLQELFKKLSSGAHLNRVTDTELWVELENHQADYDALFAALGFVLVVDGRGFAYFKSDQAGSYTGKLTRRLALLLMLLFEYQADQGLHLFQFQQWRIDTAFLDNLWQHYHGVLEAEEISHLHMLKEIFDSAVRIGFLAFSDGAYWLLPAVHRYLDLFEELAGAERLEQALEETEEMEDLL
ncbi:MAG: condensin complex protein MksE [Methylobacter sp.]